MALDHVLGRPSANWKRFEVLLVVWLGIRLMEKYKDSNNRVLSFVNRSLQNYRPWQIIMATILGRYFLSRIFLLFGLNAPEMYAKHYNRNFYRVTWILTALDAGFWTAMPIRPAFLRHIFSLVFSLGYMLRADAAEEKVRKLRSCCTVEMMRVSWEKMSSPFLWTLGYFNRPYVKYVRELWLPRLTTPTYAHRFPNWRPKTRVKVFFAGDALQLSKVNKIIYQIPGGGFVSMSPEDHEEYLRRWAITLGVDVCIVSVDYGKAPEFPFPYALDECYDIYKLLVESKGGCVGANTDNVDRKLRIALVGDSAGGNLIAGVTMKVIQHNMEYQRMNPDLFDEYGTLLDDSFKHNLLPKPEGLLVIYGALNFDMGCWITPTHAPLLRPDSSTSLSGLMKHFKGRKYHAERSSNGDLSESNSSIPVNAGEAAGSPYLALTSRMSYFSDRIITPEVTRGMALLYLGPSSSADPTKDMYLSPVVAPETILAQFPRIWMMCGECDPFVDDTVVFAGRVRQAVARRQEREQMETISSDDDDSIHLPEAPDRKSWFNNITNLGLRMSTSAEVPKESSSNNANAKFHISDDEGEESTADNGDDDDGQGVDEFGEINQDPNSHVTVKIYAGLSHAYLNLSLLLPESNHAIELCSQWLVDMFDSGETARQRRRARRMALRNKKQNHRVRMAPEMRDEDNIPDVIQYPFGAEYRSIGGTSLTLRSEQAAPPAEKAAGKQAEKVASAVRGIDVFDEPGKQNSPLRDAIAEKRRSVARGLASSAEHGPTRSHPNLSEKHVIADGKPTSTAEPGKERSKPKPPAVSTEAAGTSSEKKNDRGTSPNMFLTERQVMEKRRQSFFVSLSGQSSEQETSDEEEHGGATEEERDDND